MSIPAVVFELGWGPATDYGACVQQMDIWQESLNGVGRWEIIADPAGACSWPAVNTIATDRINGRVRLRIDAGAGPVTMMRGYVDDVLPFLDTKGYHTRLYRITGRNRGMDLAQHYVTGDYINTAAHTIIGNAAGSLLRLIPSELDRITVGVPAGAIDYEADRTYLSDAIRDIANLVNHDFYVDNLVWPANAQLNIFAPGASATAVVLSSVAGALTNNILSIEPFGEEVSFNLKNYIEGTAGSLEDHYTDLNAVDWVGTNCTVTDLVAVPPAVPAHLNGKGAIMATLLATGPAQPVIDFDLSAPGMAATYGYASMDLTEPTIGTYNYYLDDSRNAVPNLNMRLRDTAGNEIEFHRLQTGLLIAGGDFNVTEYTVAGGPGPRWRKVDFPLGYNAAIEPVQIAADTKGHWYQFALGPGINWDAIERIRFTTTGNNINVLDFFIVDGLEFPNHEVLSIQQDAVSIAAYGQRMKDFYRPDIRNQYELNDFVTTQLARLKDPKETIRVVATGQTGTPFAAQTLGVIAPAFGLAAQTVYRILRLHHRVVKNSEESNYPGYNFTTEYDLVRQSYLAGGPQYVDHTRVINITDPIQSMERKTRLEERWRRRGGTPRLIP